MDRDLRRPDCGLCCGLAVMLAGLITGVSAERWMARPLPVAVAADAPTPIDVPGIPALRPTP